MSIPFTQYLRPNGRRRQVSIERPSLVEKMAKDEINALRSGNTKIVLENARLLDRHALDGEDRE